MVCSVLTIVITVLFLIFCNVRIESVSREFQAQFFFMIRTHLGFWYTKQAKVFSNLVSISMSMNTVPVLYSVLYGRWAIYWRYGLLCADNGIALLVTLCPTQEPFPPHCDKFLLKLKQCITEIVGPKSHISDYRVAAAVRFCPDQDSDAYRWMQTGTGSYTFGTLPPEKKIGYWKS